MMISFNKLIAAFFLTASMCATHPAYAQEIIQISPLFEYPMAPESLTSLADKSNYLMEHFWDAMDFKSTTAVDQNALNDAMKVYSVPLRWADMTKADASVTKLIEKISKNPTLLTQFTKAAEEVMYGPRAEFWVDAVYMKFLDAFVKNKKIPEARKAKYETQLNTLRSTVTGQKAPTFEFTGKNGKAEKYMPMSTPTVIIFGDPTLPDWRITRLKMETNVPIRQAVDDGKLNILFIIPFQMDSWERELANYPTKWTVGAAPTISENLDIRAIPSAYYIGGDGNIILKNASVEEAITNALTQINQ